MYGLQARATARIGLDRLAIAFNPSDYGAVALWLKADALAGYEDEDVVDTWPDSSGNGNDATQGTFIKMPLYRAGVINGLPALQFDGIDDMLKLPSMPARTAMTVFIFMRPTSAQQSYAIGMPSAPTVGSNAIIWGYTSNVVEVYNQPRLSIGQWSATDFALYSIQRTTTTTTTFRNGVQISTNASVRETTEGQWVIGASDEELSHAHMRVAEILAFAGETASGLQSAMRNYIAGKYGPLS